MTPAMLKGLRWIARPRFNWLDAFCAIGYALSIHDRNWWGLGIYLAIQSIGGAALILIEEWLDEKSRQALWENRK